MVTATTAPSAIVDDPAKLYILLRMEVAFYQLLFLRLEFLGYLTLWMRDDTRYVGKLQVEKLYRWEGAAFGIRFLRAPNKYLRDGQAAAQQHEKPSLVSVLSAGPCGHGPASMNWDTIARLAHLVGLHTLILQFLR